MPELPEVETITRDLNKKIKGKTINTVTVKVKKLIKTLNTKFEHLISGKKVRKVSRRAKIIKINLGDIFLIIHLKLTGQLIFCEKGQKDLPNKFTHIIFTFTDGSHLFYNDIRKFGWMNIVPASSVNELLNKDLGPEPLSPKFTLESFKKILKRKGSQPIKKIFLDQKNIAGIGNIYADEICFAAKVKPTRKAQTLAPKEVKSLWQGIRLVLKSAIKHRGTSSDTYVDANGQKGNHTSYLKVYGRQGQKCQRHGCPGTIKKIKFASRGTHFCSQCQK